ncbi:MAG: hypothetical protein NHB14_25825 [Desulfosporosinus sp.]|nr:hypothetical protein [Desulfosporosinus sp.]
MNENADPDVQKGILTGVKSAETGVYGYL